MDGVGVRLFGTPSVTRSGAPIPRMPAKSLELFCFLLIHRERGYNRELLADVLWPGEGVASAKRYLRQALWKLNSALHSTTGEPEEIVITTNPGWLQINAPAVGWADVSEFDRAYAGLLNGDGETLADSEARALENAVALYRGELLAGWTQEWCLPERARVEQAYLIMLEQLTAWCRVRRLHTKGMGYGELALRLDPARESAHRQLMRLHHATGNRGGAVRQFQLCAEVLGREFGVRPSAQTRGLYEQILRDEAPEPPPSAPLPLARRTSESDPALHARLDQIQASLQELMALVARDRRDVG